MTLEGWGGREGGDLCDQDVNIVMVSMKNLIFLVPNFSW
jgi:hypothetical protein